jgi:arylsulfatase A-like enzyme
MPGRGAPAARRARIPVALLALALAACGHPPPATPPARPAPNVVLITIDTLRADRVDTPAFPGLTPNLDRLAAAGVRFTDATAQVPLTFPSHVSIMTGEFPSQHGARDNGSYVLGPQAVTLAERLRDRGYVTGAFVASVILSRGYGLAQGFDEYDDRFSAGGAAISLADLQRPGAEVAGDAAGWLKARPHPDRPFLLWMHLYDPHAPYAAPKAFAERYPHAPYDAEVAAADWAAGYLLDSLPTSGRPTLVVVTGDHGESLGDHGEPEHGMLLYDSTLHVPLIVSGDGLPAGVVVGEQVRHVDLVPTILDLVGAPPAAGLPGESLVPLMHGARRKDTPPSYAETWFPRLHFGWSELRAVRVGDWKYIQAPHPELYDLRKDPGEHENVIDARPELAEGLARELARLAQPNRPAEASSQGVSEQTADELRSLGYVGGGTGGPTTLGTGEEGADPKDHIAEYRAFVTAFYEALDDLEAGHAEAALRGFRAIAREHPLSFEAHQYTGRALAALGRSADALREYDVAIGLNPRASTLRFDAARLELDLGRKADAARRIAAGLAVEPDAFYGRFLEGQLAAAEGRTADAARAYDRAASLNPAFAPAHFELARLAEAGGDAARARAEYRKAVDADPAFEEARRALARLGGGNRGR